MALQKNAEDPMALLNVSVVVTFYALLFPDMHLLAAGHPVHGSHAF